MPEIEQVIPSGAQIPAGGKGASLGGGLLAAIYVAASNKTTNWALEYSPDEGTTWDPIVIEDGTAQVIVPADGGGMVQINPPLRAPYFRVNCDANQSAERTIVLHTI